MTGNILGLLKAAKTAECYKNHHPTIQYSNNSDLSEYYYDYWIKDWGTLIFTFEGGRAGAAQYVLNFLHPNEIAAVSIDETMAKELKSHRITSVTQTKSKWITLLKSIFEGAKTGDNNAGLDYRGIDIKAGDWIFNVTINDIGEDSIDVTSRYIDVSGTGVTPRHIIIDFDTITEISIGTKDFFRIQAVNDIVTGEQDLYDGIKAFFVSKKIELFPRWLPVSERGLSGACKRGDIVRHGNSKYISKVDGNTVKPSDDTEHESWILISQE